MGRFFWWLAAVIAALLLSVATGWASLALHYRLPVPDLARMISALAFGLFGLTSIAIFLRRRRWRILVPLCLALAALLAWWGTIQPPLTADWAPDVARQSGGIVNGDTLTLTNVRNFTWRSDSNFDERWETRTYDLSKLQSLDLFLSYWAGPQMAHLILSFGFEGGDQLAWSIEVRRAKGGEYSPLADLFKTDPLVIIATDERDVVRVRSNVRNEDVRLYRLETPPDIARKILLEYVADANSLATIPEFYNSITTNCTTAVAKLAQAAGVRLPLDWRLIVNGYLPAYLYKQGSLGNQTPLEVLSERARIADRAKAADLSQDFSRAIRVGMPSPLHSDQN